MPFNPLDNQIAAWDADPARVHCSNCRFARVRKTDGDEHVMAYCNLGYGVMPLTKLIRKWGQGFKWARECDDFWNAEGGKG